MKRSSGALMWPVGILLFAFVVPIMLRHSGLLINWTKSVPVGLYRKAPDQSGALAGFCLPVETIRRAIEAGAEELKGPCPGGVAPILKPIIRPSVEHPLVLSAAGFSFEGQRLINTAPKNKSRTGIAITHYPFGTYESGFWAVSRWNPDSFDSRYFGPVAPDSIRFYAIPVWTW